MPDETAPPPLPQPAPRSSMSGASRVMLVVLTVIAAWPLLLQALHASSPELAVRFVVVAQHWGARAGVGLGVAAAIALLLFPPAPAWLRRFVERTRSAWTVDRAPLLRALQELQHFESAQRHYEVARMAWIRSDLGLAGPHAARAVQLDPALPQSWHLLGQVLLRAGDPRQAAIAFHNAGRLEPGHAFGQALLFAARATHLAGDVPAALRLFEQHEHQHGGSNRSHYWYGDALAEAGRRDDAGRQFAAAAAPPPQRLTAEENWFRALARVRCWRYRRSA
ncbi:MAG: hypothetical protein H6835_12005 [Planctomycetes bacterium]|nr:hypothetical protein [Planctomycetota bacterium]